MPFINRFTSSLIEALSLLKEEGIIASFSGERFEHQDRVKAVYNINIPQYPACDIRSQESVIFITNSLYPLPLPIFEREDFPSLPHLLRNTGGIKSPCLYQSFPEQIALKWNAIEYAYRVFIWLSEASRGELHQKDQPLEDFVMTAGGKLLLPPDFTGSFSIKPIDDNTKTFILENNSSPKDTEYLILYYDLGEHEHMGIHPTPVSLFDIKQLIDTYQTEVVEKWIKTLKKEDVSIYEKRLFIILNIIIRDTNIGKAEKREYVFLTSETFGEIGLKIGILEKTPDGKGIFPIISSAINPASFQNIPVISVSLHPLFSNRYARLTNGLVENTYSYNVVQIGLGAIGSQIARNCAQAGFAESWVCVDNDSLLPHNLARWILESEGIGLPKAKIVAEALNKLFGVQDFAKCIVEKVSFGNLSNSIDTAISSASVLIDSSASIPVQRTLDYCLTNSLIRFTTFLNPNGKSLVIFFTPAKSNLLHIHLEMNYYNALAFDEALEYTLLDSENTFTYGGDSCRALSAVLSTHGVSQLSAIASGTIENWAKKESPTIGLWKTNENYSTSFHEIPVTDWVLFEKISNPRIQISSKVFEVTKFYRNNALPLETGGVLVGSYDIISDTIFIVDALSAPKDSESTPFTFHRGMKGMKKKLDEIENRTHSNLYYIGEWHSHPNGFGTNLSKLDQEQLQWLRKESLTRSFPYLMLICDDSGLNIYL